MPGTAAIRKILTAVSIALADLPEATIFIDRSEDEPFGNAELPAVNILHTGTSFDVFDHGTTLHRASIDLDMIVALESTATLSAQLDEMEAAIVGLLAADQTLGGRAQSVTPQSSEGNEQVHTEEGARLLTVEVLFLTPRLDHRTIIGIDGPIV